MTCFFPTSTSPARKDRIARLVDKGKLDGTAAQFLRNLIAAVPYAIHSMLTDNPVLSDCRRQAVEGGIQFADLPKNRDGTTAQWRGQPFDRACWRHDIEHHLIRPKHPWTNGQVERMNRTIKEAAVKRHNYHSHCQLRQHLRLFIHAGITHAG